MQQALPLEEKEVDKLPRQYIANLIYTLVGQPFQQWVNQVMLDRVTVIRDDRDLDIELDPQIYAAFQASNAVSTQKGVSSNLMKVSSKRRRGKQEIKDQKAAEEAKKAEDGRKLAEYDQMQGKMQ